MRIGGFHPFSLSDHPGRVAAIIFTQGCNFCCPWCHNRQLISTSSPLGGLIPVETVLSHLACRPHQLDGIVISGGEPTIQDDLPEFLSQVKAQGYAVKLDTNGSQPSVLDNLIAHHLVDFIAMDVKAPWAMYPDLAGIRPSIASLQNSIQLIFASGIDHEFRTTATPASLPQTCAIAAAAESIALPYSDLPQADRTVTDHANT